MKKNSLLVLFGLILLTACAPAARPVQAADPRAAGQVSFPTPAAPGQVVEFAALQVEMRQAELTTAYPTEFGSQREPPRGEKFLWVQVRLTNAGTQEQKLPAPEHFSALFGTTEFKPGYGHRQNYLDYTALKPVLYPGQSVTAWLRFEIPVALALKDLQFAFLPESFQISTAFSPGEYPWGEHPLYLWRCEP
jgi:hypothetical protein